MSTVLTILAVIVILILVVLLSLGLFVALGILAVIATIAFVFSIIFGGGTSDFLSNTSFSTSSTTTDLDPKIEAIPQDFNACLLGSDLDLCRTKFTHWDKDDIAIIQSLAKQVKEELGARGEKSGSVEQQNENINGDVRITIDQVTNFAKKENVSEHYVLTPVETDSDVYKIKELNWDY
ncbi:MAG: hypothetical protein V4655_06035 [Bdellovibrionota bacterium]|nr:MAG: hypothetical protein EOP10_28295 [Pseudomonadota bacterium]